MALGWKPSPVTERGVDTAPVPVLKAPTLETEVPDWPVEVGTGVGVLVAVGGGVPIGVAVGVFVGVDVLVGVLEGGGVGLTPPSGIS